MKILRIILQVLLVGQFGFFGVSKVLGAPDMVATFDVFGYSAGFRVFTGVVELTAVFLLLYAFHKHQAAFLGAFLIFGLTIGAAVSHAFLEGSIPNAIIPIVVFIQTAIMTWLYRREHEQTVQAVLA